MSNALALYLLLWLIYLACVYAFLRYIFRRRD